MANADSPFGLRPVSHLMGINWSGGVRKCYIPSTDSVSAYFIGDVMDFAGSADTAASCPTILSSADIGLATHPILGAIVSFEPDPTALSNIYRLDDTARYAYLTMDPFVIYEVQGETGAVFAATQVGLNACVIKTHSGVTGTGLSGTEMDTGTTSTPAANSTFPLLVLGAVNSPDNDISLVNAKWHVLISVHRLLPNYSPTDAAYFGARGVS